MDSGNSSRGYALRLLITLLTFGAMLWWVGPREIASAFANVLWFWVIARIVPYAASLWVQAARWKMFLGLEGITTDTNRLFLRIWMSRFFAQISPGSIGGDIFRVVESADFSSSRMAVARSVLLDRLVAFISLGLYTSIACLTWSRWRMWSGLGSMAGFGVVISLSLLLMLASDLPGRITRWAADRLRAGRIRTFFVQLAESLGDLGRRRGLLVGAALVTVLFNLTWATSSYFGFLALGQTISPLLVITLIPIVYAVTVLPISLNGLGVSEGVFVVVFSAAGMEPAAAAAVAILLRVTGLLMTGFGGLLFVVERRRSRLAAVR